MNYYPFHIGDYASATQHLTLEEDAMYRRLLDISYTTEKPLTNDLRQLYRLTRAVTEGHREAMLTVLSEFFTEAPDGWISTRVQTEIEICMALGLREEAQEAAKRMAAITLARQAAREAGCYFDQQGEIDRKELIG